jgi:hypothetical protein
VRYAQKREKSVFVNNMTTVLPASGRAGLHAETFSGSPELFFDPLARPQRSKWQDRRIIPVISNYMRFGFHSPFPFTIKEHVPFLIYLELYL